MDDVAWSSTLQEGQSRLILLVVIVLLVSCHISQQTRYELVVVILGIEQLHHFAVL